MAKKPDIFTIGKLDREEAVAIHAVARGEANERQQVLFVKLVIDRFSQADNLTYSPSSFDESAFLAGRAFVGKQLLRVIKTPVAKLTGESKNEQSKPSTESQSQS